MGPSRKEIIVIRMSTLGGEGNSADPKQEKERFWKAIREGLGNRTESLSTNNELLENTLRNKFGPELRNQLIQHLEKGRDLNKLTIASTVFFKVQSIKYSSLDIGLYIGTIETVAQIFDSNFDLFLTF